MCKKGCVTLSQVDVTMTDLIKLLLAKKTPSRNHPESHPTPPPHTHSESPWWFSAWPRHCSHLFGPMAGRWDRFAGDRRGWREEWAVRSGQCLSWFRNSIWHIMQNTWRRAPTSFTTDGQKNYYQWSTWGCVTPVLWIWRWVILMTSYCLSSRTSWPFQSYRKTWTTGGNY